MDCCSRVKGGLAVHLIPKVAHSAMAYAIGDKQIQQRVEPSDCEGYTRMMVVRHPLDRIVSAYTFFCKTRTELPFNDGMAILGYKRDMTFSEFLNHLLRHHNKNAHTMKQINFTGGYDIDILIPIEKLTEVWPEIAGKYKLSNFKENRANRSEHLYWEEYYTKEQRELAEQTFKEDLELYNLALEKYNG